MVNTWENGGTGSQGFPYPPSSHRLWLIQKPRHPFGMKLKLNRRCLFKAYQSWCKRAAHPSGEPISKLNNRKISRFIENAYEMVPTSIIMPTRREARIVVDLAILSSVNPEFIQQATKSQRKDKLSGGPEISTGRATACINAASLRLAISIDGRIAIHRILQVPKVRHNVQ